MNVPKNLAASIFAQVMATQMKNMPRPKEKKPQKTMPTATPELIRKLHTQQMPLSEFERIEKCLRKRARRGDREAATFFNVKQSKKPFRLRIPNAKSV